LAFVHENIPQDEKLSLLVDYFLEQLMENQNVPNEMWNINKERHSTTMQAKVGIPNHRALEESSSILLVHNLKEEGDLVSWQLKSKEPGDPSQKRRKLYVK
jgi:hypothetical protein